MSRLQAPGGVSTARLAESGEMLELAERSRPEIFYATRGYDGSCEGGGFPLASKTAPNMGEFLHISGADRSPRDRPLGQTPMTKGQWILSGTEHSSTDRPQTIELNNRGPSAVPGPLR
jgi:hypothetical protein